MASAGSIVGRADDRVALAEWLGAAAAGPAVGVEIVGEPGIGKTALMDLVLDDLRAAGWRVIRLGFTEAERSIVWSGLVDLVARLPDGSLDDLDVDQRAAFDQALGRRRGETPSESVMALVAAGCRSTFGRLVADAPTALAIDDSQWIDPATAAVLASVVRARADDRFAVAGTARPADERVLDLPRLLGPRCRSVTPRPLDRAEVLEILRSAVRHPTAPMLDDVVRLSAGNPLHVRLLGEMIATEGWQPGRLPTSIVRGFTARIERLGSEAEHVLTVAAVHGRVDARLLRDVCGPGADAALGSAERGGIVRAGRDGRLEFVHPMVPAALVGAAGSVGLREVHGALAEALTDDDEASAVHRAAAIDGRDGAVAAAIATAGRLALDRGDRHAAAMRFERAVALAPDEMAGDRWTWSVQAAQAYLSSGDLRAARPLATAAYEAATDTAQRAIAGGLVAQAMAAGGGLVQTRRFVDDLLVELEDQPFLACFLARARVRIEQVFDLGAAADLSQHWREVAARAGLDDVAGEFEAQLANCRYLLGEPVDVEAVWRRARTTSLPTDFTAGAWFALELLTWSAADLDLAFEALDWSESLLRGSGALQALGPVHDFRANLLLRIGRWEEGEAEMRRAVDVAELTELAGSMGRTGLAWVEAATGRIDRARATIAAAPIARSTEETPLLFASLQWCLGCIELYAGDAETAAHHLGKTLASVDKIGLVDMTALPFRSDLVDALVQCGRYDEAVEQARRADRIATSSTRSVARLLADRALVLAWTGAGELDLAIAAGERGLSNRHAPAFRFEHARLMAAQGAALRRAGRRKAAAEVLTVARSELVALGATPFVARVDQDLARIGGARGATDELTDAERQVASLVTAGMSNTEIARELLMSVRTVESHLTRVYRKLGVTSRTQLAAAWRPG